MVLCELGKDHGGGRGLSFGEHSGVGEAGWGKVLGVECPEGGALNDSLTSGVASSCPWPLCATFAKWGKVDCPDCSQSSP